MPPFGRPDRIEGNLMLVYHHWLGDASRARDCHGRKEGVVGCVKRSATHHSQAKTRPIATTSFFVYFDYFVVPTLEELGPFGASYELRGTTRARSCAPRPAPLFGVIRLFSITLPRGDSVL